MHLLYVIQCWRRDIERDPYSSSCFYKNATLIRNSISLS